MAIGERLFAIECRTNGVWQLWKSVRALRYAREEASRRGSSEAPYRVRWGRSVMAIFPDPRQEAVCLTRAVGRPRSRQPVVAVQPPTGGRRLNGYALGERCVLHHRPAPVTRCVKGVEFVVVWNGS